jgi:N-carbamoyl-L-amino-acid hydrolase
MAALCPSGMVFVPCKDGISHNEAESATAPDLAAGARVIAQTVAEMAG